MLDPDTLQKAIIGDVKKPVATVISQKGSPIKKSLWYLINAENCVLLPSPWNFRYPSLGVWIFSGTTEYGNTPNIKCFGIIRNYIFY